MNDIIVLEYFTSKSNIDLENKKIFFEAIALIESIIKGFLLNKDLQLDSSLTFNFKDTPSIFNMNFGVSYRFDRHEDIPKINNNTSAKSERKRRSRNRRKSKKKKIETFDEG